MTKPVVHIWTAAVRWGDVAYVRTFCGKKIEHPSAAVLALGLDATNATCKRCIDEMHQDELEAMFEEPTP